VPREVQKQQTVEDDPADTLDTRNRLPLNLWKMHWLQWIYHGKPASADRKQFSYITFA